MKIFFSFLFLVVSACASSQFPKTTLQESPNSKLEVVEISDYKFSANSFLDEKKDVSFIEKPADAKYFLWAEEAIQRVDKFLPPSDRLPHLKLKLIFTASIQTKMALLQNVPISIIESYQEPKTLSIRLGMLELKDSKESFQLTVAHEYSHLVFENASRKAGTTPAANEQIEFWSKSAYEGIADLFMSLAMDSNFTAEPGSWAAHDLNEYSSLQKAKAAKDTTVVTARSAFQKMDLIPQYPLYEDWLVKIGAYIKGHGGHDPYAEGRWLAGSLKKNANTDAKKEKLAQLILDAAKAGTKVDDIQAFHNRLLKDLH